MSTTAERRHFLFLAVGERQAQYQQIVQGLPHDIVFVDGILPLLNHCIMDPPLAVLIDAPSSARIGAALVNPFFELRMKWPIMHCSSRPDGTAMVMCSSPDQHGPLTEALAAIHAGNPAWTSPWKRRHIRVDVQCRARIRRTGAADWEHGNCLNLSRGGAFVVTYTPFAIGTPLDMEIWDLSEEPPRTNGRVVRLRPWEDSPKLPGIGIEFEPGVVTRDLGHWLVTRLTASFLTL